MSGEVFFQLFLAFILGALIGLERERLNRDAGFRTFSLVCLAACFFVVLSFNVGPFLGKEGVSYDPSRVLAAIVVGIGFLGTGVIMRRNSQAKGITTAAALWVTSAIGASIGFKMYSEAVFAVFLTLFVLFCLGKLEAKFKNQKEGSL